MSFLCFLLLLLKQHHALTTLLMTACEGIISDKHIWWYPMTEWPWWACLIDSQHCLPAGRQEQRETGITQIRYESSYALLVVHNIPTIWGLTWWIWPWSIPIQEGHSLILSSLYSQAHRCKRPQHWVKSPHSWQGKSFTLSPKMAHMV